MKPIQGTIEKRAHTSLFDTESRQGEKRILRLLVALLACTTVACIIHTIGQVMFIAHMCA